MPSTVAIACGGTGGHVFPGLAIGGELRERGHRVTALLSGQNTADHVARAEEFGLEAVPLPSVRVPQSKAGLPLFGLRLLYCATKARRILRRQQCDAVLGMGSFAAAPACLGALLNRNPLLLHEGNAVIGRANRLFARHARALAISLPLAPGQAAPCPLAPTGLPVRQAIIQAHLNPQPPSDEDFARWTLSPARETILVFGGSQGAEALNERVPAALAKLAGRRAIQVIHLSGPGRADALRKAYRQSGIPAYASERESAMEALYGLADAVICRAGASTLTELGLLGKRALLIPLPTAADDHQTANASMFVQSFSACQIPQSNADENRIAKTLEELLAAPPGRRNEAEFAANPKAAAAVADLIEKELQTQGGPGKP